MTRSASRLMIVVAVVAGVLAVGAALYAQGSKPAVKQQWEYSDGADLTLAKLNEKGAEGWELVQVVTFDNNGQYYIFKRPK
jgi:hypothetical protein